jgi:hypothetical protein
MSRQEGPAAKGLVVWAMMLAGALTLVGCTSTGGGDTPNGEGLEIPGLLEEAITSGEICGQATVLSLRAGQDAEVGSLTIANDAESLSVSFETIDGWALVETHLAVGDSGEGLPQVVEGNPTSGPFPYSTEHAPDTSEFSHILSLGDYHAGAILCLAAQAVVQRRILGAPYPADRVVSSDQGRRKDGAPVAPGASDPTGALVPDELFFSLGFGGSITVEFDCPIPNGPGGDVGIWEITTGVHPPEYVEVEASRDGATWVVIGIGDNGRTAPRSDGLRRTLSELDLGPLDRASFIRVTDVTNTMPHERSADGFEVDGVVSLQDCLEEQVAWVEGGNFEDPACAPFARHVVQQCPGACCLADGGCQEVKDETACAALGGAFEGHGTGCAATSCPVFTGACCWPDGRCADRIVEETCTALGGTFQGPGTNCQLTTCPAPLTAS